MGSASPQRFLVCGSLAFDHLLRYRGSFADYQTEYAVQALNASLPIEAYRICFGGCGGNISYGLGILKLPSILLSHAGQDFNDSYRQHLTRLGVNCDHVAIAEESTLSARCTIISDDHGNQITGFYPGDDPTPKRLLPSEIAMGTPFDFAVLAPESPNLMLAQARDLTELGRPFMFDPGQWISAFTASDLEEILPLAAYTVGNDHEFTVMASILNCPLEALATISQVLLVTRGETGVDIYQDGTKHSVPARATKNLVDATGSGDAFRAGFLWGLAQGASLASAVGAGCDVAAHAIGSASPQDYVLTETDKLQLLTRH